MIVEYDENKPIKKENGKMFNEENNSFIGSDSPYIVEIKVKLLFKKLIL